MCSWEEERIQEKSSTRYAGQIALGRTFKGFVLLATPSRGENGVIMFLAAVDISVRIKHLFTSSETVEELGEGRDDC